MGTFYEKKRRTQKLLTVSRGEKCSRALVLFRVRNDGDCWRPLARLALTTMPGEPQSQQLQKEERQQVIFNVGASFKIKFLPYRVYECKIFKFIFYFFSQQSLREPELAKNLPIAGF